MNTEILTVNKSTVNRYNENSEVEAEHLGGKWCGYGRRSRFLQADVIKCKFLSRVAADVEDVGNNAIMAFSGTAGRLTYSEQTRRVTNYFQRLCFHKQFIDRARCKMHGGRSTAVKHYEGAPWR